MDRALRWLAAKSSLVCNQLFHTDIQCSSQSKARFVPCGSQWCPIRLTVGSLHSKAARTFVGRSVLVLSNEQTQHFLRLLGRLDQTDELPRAMAKAEEESSLEMLVSSVIPFKQGEEDVLK
jgi:hypothetical protein